jgi:long-subunit acyl-CoA synthetase (AMP-forming)
MSSFGESAPSQPASEGQTISELHLRAERSTTRKVVTKHWADGRWVEMPAWRFYRQVIRVGLYLRERLQMRAGDRVALMSSLRPECVVLESATVVQGAVLATLDTRLPIEALASGLAQLAPKVTFVAGPSERAQLIELSGRGLNVGTVVAFEGASVNGAAAPPAAESTEGTRASGHLWSEVLDLGGTLDTAERAQKFRALARSVGRDAPALAHTEGSNGTTEWKFLSQGEVVRRIEDFRSRPGDVAYVSASYLPLSTLLALRALVSDGRTTIVIGTPGREVDEIAELCPHVIVAPSDVIEHAVEPRLLHANHRSLAHVWLTRVRALSTRGPLQRLPFMRPVEQAAAGNERLRDILTLDGMRIAPRNRTTGDAQ